MFDDIITLYNRQHGPDGDVWFPTIIAGVSLTMDKASIVARYGENNENSASLHIPFEYVDGEIIISGKKYREPKAWSGLADINGYITFKTGNEGDIFIAGDMGDEVIDDNIFINGFLNYAKKTYDNVFVITSIGKYKAIPHFEILGK